MAWTAQQNAAINTTGTNILVSASAGAGKTTVLVERLLKRCLEDRIPLNRIMAMTFTEAAAAEMKKRLSKELNKRYKAAPDDYLKQQMVYLQTARISTIHSFCLSVIQQHYDIIGLDPAIAQNQLSQGTLSTLKKDAFMVAWQDFIHANKEEALTLSNYFSARSEDTSALMETVLDLADTAHSSFDEEDYYNMVLENARPIKVLTELSDETYNAFMDMNHRNVERLLKPLNGVITLVQDSYPDDKSLENLTGKRNCYMAACDEDDYDVFCSLLEQAKGIKWSSPRGIKNVCPTYDTLKKSFDDMLKMVHKYLYASETLVRDHNAMEDIVISLVDLARTTRENFAAAKRDIRGMDFDDMEHFCYEILKARDGIVAAQMRPLFDEIMIDEFQDTNEIQNAIINLIAREDNVFRVGDVKQSIYRFRKARPSIMQGLKNDERTMQISLANNFRSKDHIVQFNNELFNICMNIEGAKDTYTAEDKVKSGADAQMEYTPDTIRFCMVKPDENESDKQRKANFIASKIKELHETRKGSQYTDYVVLVRTHGDKRYLRKAFEGLGIPYNIDSKEGFFRSNIVQEIASFLRLIIDPAEIDIATVLTGTYYRMSDEDLALLFLKHGSLKKAYYEEPELLKDYVDKLRYIYKQTGLAIVMDQFTTLNDAYETRFSRQQRTNFDMLYEQALQFDRDGLTIASFLNEIDNNTEDKSSEAVYLGPMEDVVRVVTIHQSKGLQYKVVFFWSNSEFKNNDARNMVIMDPDLGIGLKALYEPRREVRRTIDYMVLDHKNTLEELEENTRLLYVALTRAQNELYMVDIVDPDKEPEPGTMDMVSLLSRKGFTGTILCSMDNSKNFIREWIYDFPYDAVDERKSREVKELPRCTTPYEPVVFVTPSGTEKARLDYFNPTTTDFAKIGTSIHETMERLPNRKWTVDDVSHLDDKTQKQLLAFSASDIYHEALDGEVHKEMPFYHKNGNDIVHGTMDFVSVLEDKVILIDFKTDRNINNLAAVYHDQIELYTSALEALYHKPVEAYLYSIQHNKYIQMNRS